MVALLLMLCPQVALTPSTVLPAGCPAPIDGVLYTIDADVLAHSGREASALELRLCRQRRDEARAEVDRVGRLLAGKLSACELDLTEAADELNEAAHALDRADDRARQLAAEAAHVLPAWAWSVAGSGAPLAALGVCSGVECSPGQTWTSVGVSAALVALVALVVEL